MQGRPSTQVSEVNDAVAGLAHLGHSHENLIIVWFEGWRVFRDAERVDLIHHFKKYRKVHFACLKERLARERRRWLIDILNLEFLLNLVTTIFIMLKFEVDSLP